MGLVPRRDEAPFLVDDPGIDPHTDALIVDHDVEWRFFRHRLGEQ
ncbi:hypothetical protein EES46_02000 [Streptomyces sp. ADI98-10]|nr:hypothetical protein EES46_02000 [Streptomyces sp. ADI98-10]